jgi:hypothetical protein
MAVAALRDSFHADMRIQAPEFGKPATSMIRPPTPPRSLASWFERS